MIIQADCLSWLRSQPDNSVDICLGSPPYESQRKYNELGFNLKGQDWVDWMVERMVEMVRVTNGLVAMVVEGSTRDFRWSATPALLMADLHRKGIHLRKPPIYYRCGIPGSGGPDWLRNDYETVICCSKPGKLPWSDNKACGHAPKYKPGGKLSYRNADGVRRHLIRGTSGYHNGDATYHATSGKLLDRAITDVANPGNVIDCRGSTGGGKMGSKLAHLNEAPFSAKLCEFFIRSFCRPGGVVLDCFSGSGSAVAEAVKNGRQFIAIDIRESQCELTRRRIEECTQRVT